MTSTQQQGNEIQQAIDSLNASYQAISGNDTLHRELTRSTLSPSVWREIDALFSSGTGRMGPDLYTLYQGISSMLEMAKTLATEVRQTLRGRVAGARRQGPAGANAMLQMTSANLDSNVRVLLDRLSDLYSAVGRQDLAVNGEKRKIAASFPELADPATWKVGA